MMLVAASAWKQTHIVLVMVFYLVGDRYYKQQRLSIASQHRGPT